jgi:hypothetical protein
MNEGDPTVILEVLRVPTLYSMTPKQRFRMDLMKTTSTLETLRLLPARYSIGTNKHRQDL